MSKTRKVIRRKSRSTGRKTRDALAIIERMVGRDAEFRKLVDEASLNARIAQMIFDARTGERITQRQLAERVGTTQSVIARLEDADYEGHSLSMLGRIAGALGRRVELQLVAEARVRKRA